MFLRNESSVFPAISKGPGGASSMYFINRIREANVLPERTEPSHKFIRALDC